MVRKAIILAIFGTLADWAFAALYPIARTALSSPEWLFTPQGLFSVGSGILPILALLIFLIVLYREVAGLGEAGARRVAAFSATVGMAWLIAIAIHQIHRSVAVQNTMPHLIPQGFRMQPIGTTVSGATPALCWFVVTLIFSKQRSPLDTSVMRTLAPVLAAITAVNGCYRSYWFLASLHQTAGLVPDWVVLARVLAYLLNWISLLVLLIVLWRASPSQPNT